MEFFDYMANEGIVQNIKAYFGLGANVNKVKDKLENEHQEGVISDLLPKLKVNTTDIELIMSKKKWESKWKDYNNAGFKERQERSEKYWKGLPAKIDTTTDILNLTNSKDKPQSDNLIFQALETFLPVATKSRPDPMVFSDNTEEGIQLSSSVQKTLIYLADTLKLRLKIKQVTRYWALYFLGVMKVSWSEKNNEISLCPIRTTKLILDPTATVEEGEYTGEYIGEPKEETAETVSIKFPSKAEKIKKLVEGKMSTELRYIEWWTNEMVFWTLGDIVLDKIKNPHWNYNTTQPAVNEAGEPIVTEEFDEETGDNILVDKVEETQGNNHLKNPKMPYMFLSVFNLGKRPHDDTSLIEQNIAQQDIINKRQTQIDKNVDNMNGGWIVSLQDAGLTKEQASIVDKELRKGGTVAIPSGDASKAITKITGNSLPADVYNSQQDARNELRGIFGTTSLSSQGVAQEQTVRGKLIARQSDSSRIGGGVTEYIEEFADAIYNYMVQMMFVYYDEEHSASIIGTDGSKEFITLKSEEFVRELSVSVKEGSLIPKDSLTKANQALELWGASALDPVTLYEMLDFPNPKEAAEKLQAWQQGQLLEKAQVDVATQGAVNQSKVQEQTQADLQKAEQEVNLNPIE